VRDSKASTNGHAPRGAVVKLPRRGPSERQDGADTGGCAKCGSRFLVIEPLFVHCRYCGSLSRRTDGSLLAQEEFELRSGLRLAS
jgi:hypothetical protein